MREIDETEEDRDAQHLDQVLTKYAKLWKHLFTKYQNAGFSNKKVASIEDHQNRVPSLAVADLNKILKDHDVLPQLIQASEVIQLVRQIFKKNPELAVDMQTLNY